MVSRKRLPFNGEGDSPRVRRHCGSTPGVFHQSKLSMVPVDSMEGARRLDRWLAWLLRLWLAESKRALDPAGRTVFVQLEVMEAIVSVAEKPPVDVRRPREPGMSRVGEGSAGGLVLSYGTVLTRLAG